jgi:hypothetical protein
MTKTAKFANLSEAIWDIRDNPLEYLSSRSLTEFQFFWLGYEMRYLHCLENSVYPDILHGFHDFCAKKFRGPSNRNSFSIATFYSRNDEEAFDLWFASLRDFESASPVTNAERESSNPHRQALTFIEMLKAILKRPAMYVGSTSFSPIADMIKGWFRATGDLELEPSKEEIQFKQFQEYIKSRPIWLRPNDDQGLPPAPAWDKLILFWTSSQEEKALEKFSEYVSEYLFQGKTRIDFLEFHWKNQLERERKGRF